MIRIDQLKLPILDIGSDKEKEQEKLWMLTSKKLNCQINDIRKLSIVKKSIDARIKNNIFFVYSVDVRLHDSVTGHSLLTEKSFLKNLKDKNIYQETRVPFCVPKIKSAPSFCPVIIGSGPCGLFAALTLTKAGFKPIILERGEEVEKRREKTQLFFETGALNTNTNIQFGEGGAGTFSDGKLFTGIKDNNGFISFVLKIFVHFGADESILTDQRPHVGTDALICIVKNIRKYIEKHGGKYIFKARFCDFTEKGAKLNGILYEDLNSKNIKTIYTGACILAPGHSAYDTYEMLYSKGIKLEQKAFASGVRVQHPQDLINISMYGNDHIREKIDILGPASYKLTYKTLKNRKVYSFCMCPGGYVINSSSERHSLCINGMSYSSRDSKNANSALVVNVDKSDFESLHPLAGVYWCRALEEKAYELLNGLIPYETYGDFRRGVLNLDKTEGFKPLFKGLHGVADVRGILPSFISEAIIEAMPEFGKRIKGFDDEKTIIAGVETRTSSPVRILRNKDGSAPGLAGFYPAGEGAGYSGGITSSAIDGIKAALKIINAYIDST